MARAKYGYSIVSGIVDAKRRGICMELMVIIGKEALVQDLATRSASILPVSLSLYLVVMWSHRLRQGKRLNLIFTDIMLTSTNGSRYMIILGYVSN